MMPINIKVIEALLDAMLDAENDAYHTHYRDPLRKEIGWVEGGESFGELLIRAITEEVV